MRKLAIVTLAAAALVGIVGQASAACPPGSPCYSKCEAKWSYYGWKSLDACIQFWSVQNGRGTAYARQLEAKLNAASDRIAASRKQGPK